VGEIGDLAGSREDGFEYRAVAIGLGLLGQVADGGALGSVDLDSVRLPKLRDSPLAVSTPAP
jgi:hypothetical protein